MNILVVNYEYPPVGGGGGVICRDICEEIASKGHEVTVLTSLFDGLLPFERVNGVEIRRLPVLLRTRQNVASLPSMLSFVPLCIREGARLFRSRRFDVLNTHFAVPSGPAGHNLSGRFGVPNVLTIHGGDIFDPSKTLSPHHTFGLRQTVRRMLRGADRVVAQSSDTMGNSRKYYGIDRPIDIVPLGIRPNPYPPKTRKELGLPEDQFVLVTIGRLVRRKNLGELLEIFAGIRKEIPCTLVVIGDGPEMDGLKGKVGSMEGGSSVRMTGRVDDERKFQYLCASDIYVSTAVHEGFGIVFLEAMECGLPVVSYDRGGQTDFLKDGLTGALVCLGDGEEFSKKLKNLLISPEDKRRIGRHNREYVKEFYIGRCADRYLEIFESAIASRRAGATAS